MKNIFEQYESEVRAYCRKYPAVFDRAINAEIFDCEGRRYIDFLAVAGSMNYGHNNPQIKKAVLDYLAEDRIINALDMYTVAKAEFLQKFNEKILQPRGLNYRTMFCGPTGTNAIEAALKLARKNTGRSNVLAFWGAFHGMSLGSLAATTDRISREGAQIPLGNVTFVPYDGCGIDSIQYIETMLSDDHSGIEKPAAVILETVQAEGGINVASTEWLRSLRRVCDENDILMIVDEVQVGNGRTGSFFSFERAGIVPDMVVLSKSISGFGNPMAILLMRPELDIFKPAEHNGTFRGNQISFVGASAGIDYFVDNKLDAEVMRKSVIVEQYISENILPLDERLSYRGLGLLYGIDFSAADAGFALEVVHRAFDNGLICEVAGRQDSVLKIMPPLTIEDEVLTEGLDLLRDAVAAVLGGC